MSKALGLTAIVLIAVGAYFYFSRSSGATPKEEKESSSTPFFPRENPTTTLANTNIPSNLQTDLTAKQQATLQVLRDGYIPVNSAGAIIADTIYQGKPRKTQEAFEQNIKLKYGEATPIMRTDDPTTSIITLVGGQQQAVGRSPSSDADKYESRRANLNSFSESDKQTESYKKADAKLKAMGY